MKYCFIIVFGLFLLSSSCVDESVDPPGVENSKEYFPLNLNHFVEYQVDSIVFDDAPGGNKKDTARFLLREEISNYYINGMGDTVFYVHRFRRDHPNENWLLKDVWTAWLDENNVLRSEENLTFRKMTLPLYEGLRWIGTDYINPFTSVQIGTENLEPYQYWEARVLGIDEAIQIDTFMFDEGQAMRIRQTDTDDGAMKRFVLETYVRDIGLVARIDTVLDSRCINLGTFDPCLDKAWTDHASKGYILSQVMVDHN